MTGFRLLAGTKFIISNNSEEGRVWLIFVYLYHVCCLLKMAKETCAYRVILSVTTFIVVSLNNKQQYTLIRISVPCLYTGAADVVFLL